MAPDLNGLTAGEKWDYSQPGSAGYDIPNTTLNDPMNRKIRVLTIGAGVSGIMLAHLISKHCQNVEHVIYEKNKDIGGTWLENRYPGAACDIPSHAYTLNFALNPEWSRYFATSPEIWRYLDRVCKVFDLRKYMNFNTEVIGCYWQEEAGQWKVKLRAKMADHEPQEFWDTCALLLHATGILNNFKWPDIEGLDKFRGRLVHTARWPQDYQAGQWKGDRVAVIGSGASSIQTVPQMQPHAKSLDIFVRTGVWFVEIAGQYGDATEYPQDEREKFLKEPSELAKHAKSIEDKVNGLWGSFYRDSPRAAQVKEFFKKRMSEHIKDERLLKGFTPEFGVGCRRITPGDPYMRAIQHENVFVHFTPVTKITENTIVGQDGTERQVDTIVCATGFDVSYKPRFPLVGLNGIDLRDKWKILPESYLGLAVPDMPNFMTFIGPTWPVENGSVTGPLLSVCEYAVQVIKKIQAENIRRWSPKQDVTDRFNEHSQEWIKHTVWKEDCRAWYRNNETGRVNAVWPGSSLHYIHTIRRPRWEDMEIEYGSKGNQWAFLGMGFAPEDKAPGSIEKQTLDPSPYLDFKYMDVRWLQELGFSREDARKMVINAAMADAKKELEARLDREETGDGGSVRKNMVPLVL